MWVVGGVVWTWACGRAGVRACGRAGGFAALDLGERSVNYTAYRRKVGDSGAMVLFFCPEVVGGSRRCGVRGCHPFSVFGIPSCGCFSFQNLAFADKMLMSVSVPRLSAGRTRVDGVESSFNF
jgi:hypothetical protein